MMPGMIPIGVSVQEAETLSFARETYNAGYVSSGSMTINIKSLVPYVIAGDNMQIDGLWWRGSWCDNWKDRVEFYFKYGTAYDSGQIAGGGSKNHRIRFVYEGGETATVSHSYTGDSTSFPQAEVSIDKLVWYAVQNLPFNYCVKSLPA